MINISKSTLASVRYNSRMEVNTMGLPRTRSSTKKADMFIQMAPYIRDFGLMENVKVLELFVIERETSTTANGKQTNMTSTV